MSHEISFTDGKADALYVRKPAWHNLGKVFEVPPTRQEAQNEANLGYEVEVHKLFRQGKTPDGDHYFIPSGGRCTVRTDKQIELGIVGPDYTVVQNDAAFRVLDPLLDSGVATIDAAFALRNGADAVLVVKFNQDAFDPIVRLVFGDEVETFGFIGNNHNGRRGIHGQITPFRVECANLLGIAEQRAAKGQDRSFTLRHSQNVEVRLVEEAEKLFQGFAKRYETAAEQYATLKRLILEETEFRKYVEAVVAPDPRLDPAFNPQAKLAELVVDRYERKAKELRRLWDEGAGHSGDHSAWEAYNAAAELLDHNNELFPGRGGVSARAYSTLYGTYNDQKQRVLENLVEVGAALSQEAWL